MKEAEVPYKTLKGEKYFLRRNADRSEGGWIIEEGAEVHPTARLGSKVFIEKGTKIEALAMISGPVILRNCTIKYNANLEIYEFRENIFWRYDNAVIRRIEKFWPAVCY